MADDEASPRPFRRERNLSNRNFNKRSSNRRRVNTGSHNAAELNVFNNTNAQEEMNTQKFSECNDTSTTSISTHAGSINATSSSINISYSVDKDTENAFNKKCLLKMSAININLDDGENIQSSQINCGSGPKSPDSISETGPQTPDPAFLDVKQKLQLFENLQGDEGIIFKTAKYKSKSSQSFLQAERQNSFSSQDSQKLVDVNNSEFLDRSDEEHSEDKVDGLEDEINKTVAQENAEVILDNYGRSPTLTESKIKENTIPLAAINQSFLTPVFQHSKSLSDGGHAETEEGIEGKTVPVKQRNKEFPRNYRSRPKTEVIDGLTQDRPSEANKFNSLYHTPKEREADDEEKIELRDKSFSFIQPILEELIKTEESYVENLWIGIKNYGNIFQRADLPLGLKGKKYVLFGNIEQIAEFHRDEFLPMLQRNKHDLKRIFDEFKQFIDENCFYGYVLFTMNKKRSLKLCDLYKNYFKLLQNEIDDKLGINSFLVQPIQRMARYPLLLQQFITTLFKNRDYVMKPIIESCCRLEKKFRNLLITTNESEIINDIVCVCDDHEFNIFYQGKFRKVSEFQATDHNSKRSFRSKVFIFDKCIIYTEIKGKHLIFRDRYPCEHIGISAKTKQFTLFYDQRHQKECDFVGDQALIDQWLDLIRDMITAYAAEERRKLKELHSHEFGSDLVHRKPPNLSLFRDSNRFSSDSGIGNIWVVPKPDQQEESASNRTTWYAGT